MDEAVRGAQPPGMSDEVKAAYDRALVIQLTATGVLSVGALCLAMTKFTACFNDAFCRATAPIFTPIFLTLYVAYLVFILVSIFWDQRHTSVRLCQLLSLTQLFILGPTAFDLGFSNQRNFASQTLSCVLLVLPFIGVLHIAPYFKAVRAIERQRQ